MSTTPEIPDEQVTPEKGFYHGVYIFLKFNKEDGVYRKKYEADMEHYPDEEDMEDVNLDYEKEHHWRMVFEDNYGGVDDKK